MRTKNMRVPARKKGNTLIIMLVCIGLLAVLVGFVVLNYNQLFGSQKRAQSAIDAAALACAHDIGRVVVDCPLGRIGLVDDASAQSSYSSSNQGNTQDSSPMKSDIRPIVGINTIKATLRLDGLIAAHPSINNGSLKYLIDQDLKVADEVTQALRARVLGAVKGNNQAYDKYGNVINIKQDTINAYNNFNSGAIGSTKTSGQITNVAISVGSIKGAPSTNLPTPLPKSSDMETQGQPTYLPYKDYSVPGTTKSVQFLPTASEASLLDANSFTTAASADIPVAVKVEADENLKAIAGQQQGGLHSIAYAQAQCGNQPGGKPGLASINIMGPSGALVVAFPNGIPSGTSTSPSSAGSKPLDFSTLVGIMNASQLDPTRPSSTSSYSNWNEQSKGIWRQAQGSSIPWSQPTSQSNMKPGPFKGMSGHEDDDPSVALAFLVHDWLKSVGIRPSVTAAVGALTFNYKQEYFSTDNTSPKKLTGDPRLDIATPVYAQGSDQNGEIMGVMVLDQSGFDDPRNLTKYPEAMDEYNQQQARMWGYVPADGVLPMDTMLAALSPDGSVTTVNGSPSSDLNDLLNAIVGMDAYAVQTFNNVQKVLLETAIAEGGGMQNQTNKAQQDRINEAKQDVANWQSKDQAAGEAAQQSKQLADNLASLATATANKDFAAMQQLAGQTQQLIGSLGAACAPNATTVSDTNLGKLSTFSSKSLGTVSGSMSTTQYNAFKTALGAAKTTAGTLLKDVNATKAATGNSLTGAQALANGLESDLSDQSNYYDKSGQPRISLQAAAKIFAKRKYLLYAWNNAMYCTKVAVAMKNSLRTLTGGGVTKISPGHFKVMGTDFYPATRAASTDELKTPRSSKGVLLVPNAKGVYVSTDVLASTGQDSALKTAKSWCAGPSLAMASQLNFFKRTADPKIGQRTGPQDRWILPALAQTSYGSKKHKLIFRVLGGTDQPGTGQIQIQPVMTSPYAEVPCIQGQEHYQNVTALIMAATNDPNTKVDWQVQARDQNANAFPGTSDSAAPKPNPNVKYFTETNLANACTENNFNPNCMPALAAEWSIFCPTVESPPVTPPETPPPPDLPPAPPQDQPPRARPCDQKVNNYLIKPNSKTGKTGEIIVGAVDSTRSSSFTQGVNGQNLSGSNTATNTTYQTSQITTTFSASGWMDISITSGSRGNFLSDIKTSGYSLSGQFVDGSSAQAADSIGSYFTFLIYGACNPSPTRNHI